MKKIICLALCLTLFLTSCVSTETQQAEIFAMDTFVQLRIWDNKAQLSEVSDLIRMLDATLSAHNEQSEIFALNQNKTAELSPLASEILTHAINYSRITDGAFDPTVFPIVQQWKAATDVVPIPVLSGVSYENVILSDSEAELKNNAAIDLGGIAKGFAAQKCAELLVNAGVDAALLSLGGNVQTVGSKPDGSKWSIGIADPNAPSEHIAVFEFEGSMALVTSGNYQRYYDIGGKRYHHIIDPKTGFPAENELTSVTILAQDGAMADAYSTALFVMGLDKAIEFWKSQSNFEAIFVLKDGSLQVTEGAAPLLTQCDFSVIER